MLDGRKAAAIWLCMLALVIAFGGISRGQIDDEEAPSWIERDTLTGGWFGLQEKLERLGIRVDYSLTQVYQRNVRGGLSTHRRSGDYTGSHGLELAIDLDLLADIRGGSVVVVGEGSWRNGVDPVAVGSLFGVNGDAAGNRSFDITEAWYEQYLFQDKLVFRAGKMNLTGGFECHGCPVAFDGNTFANDETSQFLNGALVNNPTIPFPDNGLGVAALVRPLPRCYVAAGVADAQADARETGFNTAFHDEDYFFSVAEVGLLPLIPSSRGGLQGAYRFGVWYDPQPKATLDGTGTRRDDIGVYLSHDQALWRERADGDDSQGLGVFGRWGWADPDVSAITTFWSVGGQYQGIIPTRDDDVLAFGMAHGKLARAAALTARREVAYEAYYNAALAGWMTMTPSVQYVENPGGMRGADNAIVLGLRLNIAF